MKIRSTLSTQFFSISRSKGITIIGSVIFVFILIDMTFSFAATTVKVSANWEIALFVFMAFIYGITQFTLLGFIKSITKKIRSTVPLIKMLNIFVLIVQYVLLAFVAAIVIEMLVGSNYHTAILNWGTAINFSICGGIWGVLAIRLLSWYRSTRSYVVLSYALSSISAGIGFLIFLPYNAGVLLGMPMLRSIQTPPTTMGPIYDLQSTMGLLQYVSSDFIFITVALLWLSSVLMIRRYSHTIGRVKFWIIIAIPLLISVIVPTGLLFAYIPSLLGIPSSNIPLYLTLLYTIFPGVLSGILFGAPFFLIARKIPSTNILKEYLVLTAWGLIIFNVATSGNVLNAAYPPFGFSTVMIEVTACYLILVGLYSAAISISADSKLRQLIKRSFLDESKLLDSIGSAQIEQETMSKISRIVKEQQRTLAEQTGVQSSTDETDIKRYLQEVIIELEKHKK